MNTDGNSYQKDIFKKMSPEKRLLLMCGLMDSARMLKYAALKQANPHLSETELLDIVKKAFIRAVT